MVNDKVSTLDLNVLKISNIDDFAAREIHDNDIEEDIREAFRVFDREGHGFITVPDLTHVLQTLGERLSSEETQVKIYPHRYKSPFK